jgi:hypothetical protein
MELNNLLSFVQQIFAMTQLTLNIPDNKISFFLQLLNEFNYITVQDLNAPIQEVHKELVRAIKTKPADFIEADSFFKILENKIL